MRLPDQGTSTTSRGKDINSIIDVDSTKQPNCTPTYRRQARGLRDNLALQVRQYLSDDYRALNAGNHFHGTAARRAGLDVESEHPLQALRPGHVRTVFGGRSITVRGVSVKHTVSGMAILRCIPAAPIF